MNANYNHEMEKEILKMEKRERLLLHSCCGPCSTAVLERLVLDFEITVFFYNPNIRPAEEFEKRLYYQKQVIEQLPGGFSLITPGWRGEDFDKIAEGMEHEPEGGARCTGCFSLRINEAAKIAKEAGFDRFCTTLTVSPHKDANRINQIGMAATLEHGVVWLPSDFKKKEGYKRSIELSGQMELYRQAYCGCSLPENDL